MKVILIACMARNRVIGNNGQIPWMGQFPEDMKHFKRTTQGHAVVMGRKTWDSIGRKPLPNRLNLVLSRETASMDVPGVWTSDSVEGAIAIARRHEHTQCFIIGGSEIYRKALPVADEIFLTVIDRDYAGDTFFPMIDQSKFNCWAVEDENQNDAFSYRFEYWRRK